MVGELEITSIRPSSGDDTEVEALVRIWRGAVEATHSFLTASDIDFYESQLRQYIPVMKIHVGETAENGVVGFLANTESKIDALFVDVAVRGKGLGTIFLDWLAEQYDVLTVDVNQQNPEAVGFYQHYGFRETGRSPLDDQGRPFPLIHMRKEIDVAS